MWSGNREVAPRDGISTLCTRRGRDQAPRSARVRTGAEGRGAERKDGLWELHSIRNA